MVLVLCDPTLTDANCKKLFAAIDADGSGAISMDEFVDYFFAEATTLSNDTANSNAARSSPTEALSPSKTEATPTPTKLARESNPTLANMPTPSSEPHVFPEVSSTHVIVDGASTPGMFGHGMGNIGAEEKGLLNIHFGKTWKMLNSSGTTKMSAGNNVEALQDFEAALALNEDLACPDKEGLGIIWNNNLGV